MKQQLSTESKDDTKKADEGETDVKSDVKSEQIEVEIVDKDVKEEPQASEEAEDLKDAWDATSSEEGEDEAEEGTYF